MLVDQHGKPFNAAPASARRELVEMLGRKSLEARYDAAEDTDEFKNYWANADSGDADSANSKAVRDKLVPRSRYEVGNNGYVDGIVQTHCNFLVGTGPILRMRAANESFNATIEILWTRSAKAMKLRRKLWCLAHAKVQDGESFAVLAFNEGLSDVVQLDVVPIETERVTTPQLPINDPGYIDGIKFDDYSNPEWYDVLAYHPGSEAGAAQGEWGAARRVPASNMCHWFAYRRPGQHRAVPELKSTLNVGAASRRFREATVGSAETAASFSVLLKTILTPDASADPVAPMSTLDIQKRMMVALPMGWDASQLRSEHPSTTYDMFTRQQLNETARPKSMPYNLAAADSSSYNYASGRLDHQTYFRMLDVERADCEDSTLDVIFAAWWRVAVVAYGFNADPHRPPEHSWDWPKHPVADLQRESAAVDSGLRNGTKTLTKVFSEAGVDFADSLVEMAKDYGVNEKQMRKILLNELHPKAGVAIAEGISLNGAQIQSAVTVLQELASGNIAEAAAEELLVALGLERTAATKMTSEQAKITIKQQPAAPMPGNRMMPQANGVASNGKPQETN